MKENQVPFQTETRAARRRREATEAGEDQDDHATGSQTPPTITPNPYIGPSASTIPRKAQPSKRQPRKRRSRSPPNLETPIRSREPSGQGAVAEDDEIVRQINETGPQAPQPSIEARQPSELELAVQAHNAGFYGAMPEQHGVVNDWLLPPYPEDALPSPSPVSPASSFQWEDPQLQDPAAVEDSMLPMRDTFDDLYEQYRQSQYLDAGREAFNPNNPDHFHHFFARHDERGSAISPRQFGINELPFAEEEEEMQHEPSATVWPEFPQSTDILESEGQGMHHESEQMSMQEQLEFGALTAAEGGEGNSGQNLSPPRAPDLDPMEEYSQTPRMTTGLTNDETMDLLPWIMMDLPDYLPIYKHESL
ncbi:hypothetical protein MMC28_003270 [Mycoblastus sanguinarius]|nr:hypothetical protein [Mycoblastus sanguinarius]